MFYHTGKHSYLLYNIQTLFYFIVDLCFVSLPVSPTGSVIYTEVRTFMKQQPTTTTTAYKSITTSLNKTISLSSNHLLYARKYGTDKFQKM